MPSDSRSTNSAIHPINVLAIQEPNTAFDRVVSRRSERQGTAAKEESAEQRSEQEINTRSKRETGSSKPTDRVLVVKTSCARQFPIQHPTEPSDQSTGDPERTRCWFEWSAGDPDDRARQPMRTVTSDNLREKSTQEKERTAAPAREWPNRVYGRWVRTRTAGDQSDTADRELSSVNDRNCCWWSGDLDNRHTHHPTI